jgi:hypothetical protein
MALATISFGNTCQRLFNMLTTAIPGWFLALSASNFAIHIYFLTLLDPITKIKLPITADTSAAINKPTLA